MIHWNWKNNKWHCFNVKGWNVHIWELWDSDVAAIECATWTLWLWHLDVWTDGLPVGFQTEGQMIKVHSHVSITALHWWPSPFLPLTACLLSIYVLSSLGRVYKTLNRPEDALSQCESSLRLLAKSGQLENTCAIYRDMAAIERDRGRMDRAIEHLSKARTTRLQHNVTATQQAVVHKRKNTWSPLVPGSKEIAGIWQCGHASYVVMADLFYFTSVVSARHMPLLWITAQSSWRELRSPTAWLFSFLLLQSPITMVSFFQTRPSPTTPPLLYTRRATSMRQWGVN